MGFSFHFSSLYHAPYIELYVCLPIQISHLNFKVVLALPKTAQPTLTNKSTSVIYSVLYDQYLPI